MPTIFGLSQGLSIALYAFGAIAVVAILLIFRSQRIAAKKQQEPVATLGIGAVRPGLLK